MHLPAVAHMGAEPAGAVARRRRPGAGATGEEGAEGLMERRERKGQRARKRERSGTGKQRAGWRRGTTRRLGR
jgi:hypothetical protein